MKNKIIKIFNIIFALTFIYVIYNAIFQNTENTWQYNPLLVIICTIIYIGIFILIYKWLTNKKKINGKIIILLFLFVICLQLVIGYLFKVNPAWDVEDLFNVANEIIKKDKVNSSDFLIKRETEKINLDYFYKYKNNLGMEIILLGIFKIADILKCVNQYDLSMLTNIILIDLSILFTYLCAKKMYGENKAFIVFLFLIMMTPIYLYVPIIYTDTYSMLFPVLAYYLYLLAEERTEKKYVYYIIMSIIITIGMIIKPTVGIIAVSIIIINLLYENFKNIISLTGILISIISITTILFNNFVPNIVFKDWNDEEYNRKKLPLSNWIMMGLQETGTYSVVDHYNITNIEGYEGKKQYAHDRINKRFRYIQITGINKFLVKKLNTTWGEGTYFAQVMLKINSINKGEHHEFIIQNGNKTIIYKYFSQAQHMTMIILILLSAFNVKNKNQNVLKLAIFGVLIFFAIWEARSRYLVNYLPIMTLLGVQGIENLFLMKDKILKYEIRNILTKNVT